MLFYQENHIIGHDGIIALYVPIDFISAPHERRHRASIWHVWIYTFRHQVSHDGRVAKLCC